MKSKRATRPVSITIHLDARALDRACKATSSTRAEFIRYWAAEGVSECDPDSPEGFRDEIAELAAQQIEESRMAKGGAK
jgi:hypothetical protein